MDDAQQELLTAIEVARTALRAYREKPVAERFRAWRDASEVAIKWHREVRRVGAPEADLDTELDEILAK